MLSRVASVLVWYDPASSCICSTQWKDYTTLSRATPARSDYNRHCHAPLHSNRCKHRECIRQFTNSQTDVEMVFPMCNRKRALSFPWLPCNAVLCCSLVMLQHFVESAQAYSDAGDRLTGGRYDACWFRYTITK